MKPTLLIMAAGIGSRYGGGIKQLATIDKSGHIIMDYSIHDAIYAGFKKIIFVIRKDIEKDFREIIGERIEKICNVHNIEVCYAFQSLKDVPNNASLPTQRTKPWGTGQAVLSAKEYINDPFVVINADDYYGKSSFKSLYEYLVNQTNKNEICMSGFLLKNTLSENGTVTRAICSLDENYYVLDMKETYEIAKTITGAKADGKDLDINSYVSMNMWGFTPEFLGRLEKGFEEFFANTVPENPLKAEYLLPVFVGELIKSENLKVKVINTKEKWFGVTYIQDKKDVEQAFKDLIEQGTYNENLFSDL